MVVMQLFLSYNERDKAFAQALRVKLGDLGVRVWDPNELLPGSNWLLETGRALERADGIVFLISSKAERSRWTQLEMEYALTNRRYKDRVVPVLLEKNVSGPWVLRNVAVAASDKDASKVAKHVAHVFNQAGHSSKSRTSRASRSSASTAPKTVGSRSSRVVTK